MRKYSPPRLSELSCTQAPLGSATLVLFRLSPENTNIGASEMWYTQQLWTFCLQHIVKHHEWIDNGRTYLQAFLNMFRYQTWTNHDFNAKCPPTLSTPKPRPGPHQRYTPWGLSCHVQQLTLEDLNKIAGSPCCHNGFQYRD